MFTDAPMKGARNAASPATIEAESCAFLSIAQRYILAEPLIFINPLSALTAFPRPHGQGAAIAGRLYSIHDKASGYRELAVYRMRWEL